MRHKIGAEASWAVLAASSPQGDELLSCPRHRHRQPTPHLVPLLSLLSKSRQIHALLVYFVLASPDHVSLGVLLARTSPQECKTRFSVAMCTISKTWNIKKKEKKIEVFQNQVLLANHRIRERTPLPSAVYMKALEH